MLLMIPGPIEVSPAVGAAFDGPPPSHLAPDIIEAHGRALELMRTVWAAGPEAQPFIMPGSGTIAMDSAVANLVGPDDRVLVINTGYFSDRIAEMAKRRGAIVTEVRAEPGTVPSVDAIETAMRADRPALVCATHVDTSTGVRLDPEPVCRIARELGAMTIFDGVCATGGERFEMEAWGADVYLTASQKAIGLPVGLALLVASPAALAAREKLEVPPPMALDWQQWLPIMRAYEARRPSYFSTPASNLVRALPVSLGEIIEPSLHARIRRHASSAAGMRAAWSALGLELLCAEDDAANTLSALRYPKGVDASLVAAIKEHGVVVAGGLYPGLQSQYFRVGHMGYSATQSDHLETTIRAVARALNDRGHGASEDEAVQAFASKAGFQE